MATRTMMAATTALALACMLAPAARAQDGLAHGGGGGVSYVSGGIGIEERAALAARRAEFNLHLTFANRGTGELLAGVTLRVLDAKHDTVLFAEGVGPHVYLQLPPGRYRVNARADRMDQTRSVKIMGRGARAIAFHATPASHAAGGGR